MMHKLLATTGTLLCCDVLFKTQQLSTFWIFSHSFVLIELCSTSLNLQFTWAGDLLARGQRTDPTWRWGEGHELAFWLLRRKAWEAVSSSITLRKILLLSNIASTGCSRIFSRSSGAEGGLGEESNANPMIVIFFWPIAAIVFVLQSYGASPSVFHLAEENKNLRSRFSFHLFSLQNPNCLLARCKNCSTWVEDLRNKFSSLLVGIDSRLVDIEWY